MNRMAHWHIRNVLYLTFEHTEPERALHACSASLMSAVAGGADAAAVAATLLADVGG